MTDATYYSSETRIYRRRRYTVSQQLRESMGRRQAAPGVRGHTDRGQGLVDSTRETSSNGRFIEGRVCARRVPLRRATRVEAPAQPGGPLI